MDNWMELSFPSLSVNESFARSAVAAFAASLNPTLDELSDLRFHQEELFAAWEAAMEEQESYEQSQTEE